ncbi:uracil-DNA glycosylase [Desertihabitans brevis]|uniref:Type-4 uracil-DNA glycosylase n=1 Tax=Desertihabitans brevis TaxID=2268447 RepID=A0A367Z0Q4_9ACTN|nr:UdgX family uracil-DNA binding protein [Desertihabitans brevis]RCK70832.1 uracil-DNA glycosylase [Desertihabitans brevis]
MSDASEWVPDRPTVPRLARAARDCHGCELWEDATQVVFSSGDPSASLVLVGEQPGDQEDRAGEPFVGPAGRVLDRALEAAGVPRAEVYLTNAVKHFRHRLRGKRRLHQKPDVRHLVACRPWLAAELDVVDPDVVVALGASAGRSVLGRTVRVGAERGRVLTDTGRPVVLTTHPSALLRLQDREGYAEAFDALVADLVTAAGARG